MRQSMTGFASRQGETAGLRWSWELRGVNGKGLELRLRLPDWIEGLEPQVRAAAQKALARGNVQISLKTQGNGEEAAAELDEAVLTRILTAMARIEGAAAGQGLVLSPSSAAQIVALRGVLSTSGAPADITQLRGEMLAAFGEALEEFTQMRRTEGAALAGILTGQLDEIENLVAQAAAAVEARRGEQDERLRAQLQRVMEGVSGVDEARVAQELAVIAVKSDVTEELDRLTAHVAAARDLLAAEGAVGRRLDFLMQEFNREANTLCSKSGSAALTQVGLTLKTVIDQMREQVQNVE
ncbi:YicC/YloC family endoribonuclease [Salipiger sp. PrR002]|uniref:YicC/YloC family endoribonuclease n=1 Tax=Salipiger sp. PrR002 TaxID=2706489 RepID=UPI0013BB4585|nr:YicC/YloC family endoribonuclease [Salipiger sp. PrR002]NDV99229.1 YicC family protein [Salipiger sp. PrR002]NDW55715.1 YicC family protein [Salipiger sp. PrR004]